MASVVIALIVFVPLVLLAIDVARGCRSRRDDSDQSSDASSSPA